MAARAIVAAALLCGCAATDVGGARRAIVGGEVHSGDPAVVALVARRLRCGDDRPQVICSGTLVGPRVVLMAAHCTDLFGPNAPYEVMFGASFDDPDVRFVRVTSVEADPAFVRDTHEHDVAVAVLAETAPTDPVPLPTSVLDADAVGLPARIVGFGVDSDVVMADGEKRQGTMTVSSVDPGLFEATPDPSNTCEADSGGPVFVELDGTEQLVGVTVSGDPSCTRFALNVRVDAVLDFLEPALEAHSGPPPDPGATLEAGALCGATCEDDAQCPAGLSCERGPSSDPQCLLPGLPAGNYTDACSTDDECGSGICARLASAGADACRCLEPCETVRPPGDDDSGCAATHDRHGGAGTGLLLLACTAVGARRRRRARPRRRG